MLWSEREFCPDCDRSEQIHHFPTGRRHKCKACGRGFRISTGIICSDSPIQLWPKRFLAIYLDTCQSQGSSSVQLAQTIGVQQPTAWSMLQRMRSAAGT